MHGSPSLGKAYREHSRREVDYTLRRNFCRLYLETEAHS
jgi:hypothetical protein